MRKRTLREKIRLARMVLDDEWKTVNGAKVLLGEGGEIKGGLGGKFTGKKLSQVKGKGDPRKQTEKVKASELRKPETQSQNSEQKSEQTLNPSESVTGKEAEVAAILFPTDSEASALQEYTDSDGPFYEINSALRNGTQLSGREAEIASQMDSAFEKANTTSQITAYRGLTGDFVDRLEIGSEFTDGGFTSTSSSEKVARDFTDRNGGVMEVVIPKGSKAISTIGLGTKAGQDEGEIILNRGGTYKVVDIKPGPPRRPVVEYRG